MSTYKIEVADAPPMRAGGSKKAPGLTDMGVTGMRSLGVRELTYKLCFAACYTMVRRFRPAADGQPVGAVS
jgi:hypothetical protein